MESDITAQIEKAARRLDERAATTDNIRMEVVDKLRSSVSDMTLDPNIDKASTTEAKVSVVNSLIKALSDVDKQHLDNVKVKQRMKADEVERDNSAIISQTITQFLKTVKEVKVKADVTTTSTATEVDDALAEATNEDDFEILDSELEFNSKTAQDIDI